MTTTDVFEKFCKKFPENEGFDFLGTARVKAIIVAENNKDDLAVLALAVIGNALISIAEELRKINGRAN